jgi:hypothetical protein
MRLLTPCQLTVIAPDHLQSSPFFDLMQILSDLENIPTSWYAAYAATIALSTPPFCGHFPFFGRRKPVRFTQGNRPHHGVAGRRAFQI